jgi:peptidoglycan/xylan/chitin deacetylase (PgdA/CDA1 family)
MFIRNHCGDYDRVLVFLPCLPAYSNNQIIEDFMPRSLFLLCFLFVIPNMRPSAQEISVSVPILMYHYVREVPVNEGSATWTLDTKTFHQHLDYLDKEGYQTISLYQLDDALRNGTPLPEKPIILTFDDGYSEHYDFVFPLLQRYGMTGTFFIVSNWVGNSSSDSMTWEQLSEMAEAGMSIESHTMSHPDLRNHDEDYLRDEIMGCVDSMESHLGFRPRFFAYPYGGYDAATLAFLETTDILGAVTVQGGSTQRLDKPYEWRRLTVTNQTDLDGLKVLLSRG